jgi:glycosyltransferase involved in cell wall biosynthesis
MLISVVTPNRNGATYFDKTLSSITAQQGCKIELVVIDGASTDASPEVIRRYADRISYWVSESDRGMYDAINKGMRQTRGDILAYLNSDDFYYPGTLSFVTRYFQDHPETDLLYGDLNFVDAQDSVLFRQRYPDFQFSRFRSMRYATIGQPAAFWRRSLWERVGEFDISLKMASDFDFFIRAGQAGVVTHVPQVLSAFRVHEGSMTQRQLEVSSAEVKELHQRYLGSQSEWLSWLYHHLGNIHFKAINITNWPQRLFSALTKKA